MSLTPYHCSVHTHTSFCDGKNTMAEMVEAAFRAGIRYYGVSGHAHTPCPSDVGVCMGTDMTAYRQEVLRLREEYAGRMEVLLGLEWDALSDVSHEGFDYWIGSVHNLQVDGTYFTVDWTGEHLEENCRALYGGDYDALAEAYYREVGRVAAMKPTILGHIDLITKLNAGNRFFDENSLRYKAAALNALQKIDREHTALEINTGAMARGYREAPYPALFLLQAWREMGGRIILTADAHTAAGVLYAYDDSVALAKAAGFDCCTVLTMDGFLDCPL